MEWWDKVILFPIRRVWVGVATTLGIRKSANSSNGTGIWKQTGLLKLRHDVRTCEYEDVQVMWEMLSRTNTDLASTPPKKPNGPFWKIIVWTTRAPFLCRSF
ncbi:hypothetical protein HHK36_008307 [Tetracentron sinense]|uniref:Uncharacterized protein n=1 Tax=Tetracentron sinense TaxID=13715 RepID=A0A834ZPY2_TETSI|nr:hypothetical protein HHK36_008307 [Tetracentron sinense]